MNKEEQKPCESGAVESAADVLKTAAPSLEEKSKDSWQVRGLHPIDLILLHNEFPLARDQYATYFCFQLREELVVQTIKSVSVFLEELQKMMPDEIMGNLMTQETTTSGLNFLSQESAPKACLTFKPLEDKMTAIYRALSDMEKKLSLLDGEVGEKLERILSPGVVECEDVKKSKDLVQRIVPDLERWGWVNLSATLKNGMKKDDFWKVGNPLVLLEFNECKKYNYALDCEVIKNILNEYSSLLSLKYSDDLKSFIDKEIKTQGNEKSSLLKEIIVFCKRLPFHRQQIEDVAGKVNQYTHTLREKKDKARTIWENNFPQDHEEMLALIQQIRDKNPELVQNLSAFMKEYCKNNPSLTRNLVQFVEPTEEEKEENSEEKSS